MSSAKTSPDSAKPLHATEPLIDIDDVSVRIGQETVLDRVTFCVHPSEFIGLVGPNGAGKTTLLRVVLGLAQPQKGSVKRAATTFGYIPQRGGLQAANVPISVLEVVRLGANGNVAKARQALQDVRMQDTAHRQFNELSGGQQQRVIIAKALASDARMLIMDEPTTGIDDRSQTEFYALLRALQQAGMTILMVSHEVDTVLSLVTRVICLNNSILYDGPPKHFEADTYLPQAYKAQHVQLHHRHKDIAHA